MKTLLVRWEHLLNKQAQTTEKEHRKALRLRKFAAEERHCEAQAAGSAQPKAGPRGRTLEKRKPPKADEIQ